MNTRQPTTPRPRRSGQPAAALPPAGSAAAEPTRWQLRLQARRRHQLETAHRLIASGLSRAAAAAEAGIGWTTLWRLERLVEEKGIEGLLPKIGKGAPPLLDPALFTPAVVDQLQRLAVKLGGVRAGARAFSGSRQCPRPLARYIISRDSIPEKLRKLIGFRRAHRPVRFAGGYIHVEGAGADQRPV